MSSIVYNSDCMDIMPKYPDRYFDLAICDIPYGIGAGKMPYLGDVSKSIKQKNGSRITPKKKKRQIKDWDSETPSQDYFDELRRISTNQIIFGVDYVNWDGVGPGRIRWDKGVADTLSFNRYEVAYCSIIDHEVELPLLWSGMMQAKSIHEPMVQQGNKKLNENRIHPCHKPILLYDKLLIDYGFTGMKVIDTHLGGGSIRISADRFGVSEFVGIEKDAEHFKDHQDRWNAYKKQLNLFKKEP